jgi:hypothetical protein
LFFSGCSCCSSELAMTYFDLIGRASNDNGLSVRKRAIKVRASGKCSVVSNWPRQQVKGSNLWCFSPILLRILIPLFLLFAGLRCGFYCLHGHPILLIAFVIVIFWFEMWLALPAQSSYPFNCLC